MSDGKGFFMVDKLAAQLLPNDRQFTELEALCSFEIDRNNGKEWSYKGYGKLWGWNVKKVRRFIKALLSEEGLTRTGNRNIKIPVRLINSNISMGPPVGPPMGPLNRSNNAGSRGAMGPPMGPPVGPYYKTKTKTKDLLSPEHCSEQAEKIKIPLKNGTEFIVHESFIEELGKAYPELDIPSQLQKIRAWNVSNDSKRKTLKGIKRHINSWLSRASSEIPKPEKQEVADCSTCRYQNTDLCKHCEATGSKVNFQHKDDASC